MIYDRTCKHTGGLPLGLTHAWWVGARLYRGLGALDAWAGVSSWDEGLRWLAGQTEPIDEIQFRGHGNWGLVRVGSEALTVAALRPNHRHYRHLEAIRANLAPDALWWFRTCDTLGARSGQEFAQRWAGFFARPVAGFTHIIGPYQSGLHRLEPDARPHWDPAEGIREGTPEAPLRSMWSRPGLPNTISCLHSTVPAGW